MPFRTRPSCMLRWVRPPPRIRAAQQPRGSGVSAPLPQNLARVPHQLPELMARPVTQAPRAAAPQPGRRPTSAPRLLIASLLRSRVALAAAAAALFRGGGARGLARFRRPGGGGRGRRRRAAVGQQREQVSAGEALEVLDDLAMTVVRREMQACGTVCCCLEEKRLAARFGQVLHSRKVPPVPVEMLPE